MIARAVSEASRAGLLASGIELVIFDRTGPTDAMIAYCTQNHIRHGVIDPKNLERSIIDLQKANRLDWLGLTFNRLLPQRVISAFHGNIFNLHFSLLPDLPGFGATAKALQSGLPSTGVTVHLIDAGIDTGPIIAQARVDISPQDTVETLGQRQFRSAVPLAIQTVRRAERGHSLPFVCADEDVEAFSRMFCDRLN